MLCSTLFPRHSPTDASSQLSTLLVGSCWHTYGEHTIVIQSSDHGNSPPLSLLQRAPALARPLWAWRLSSWHLRNAPAFAGFTASVTPGTRCSQSSHLVTLPRGWLPHYAIRLFLEPRSRSTLCNLTLHHPWAKHAQPWFQDRTYIHTP